MDKIETLKHFLANELQAPVDVMTPEYALIANKVIDSMGIFQLVTFIEGEYEIAIDDEDLVLDNFKSISAIVSLIDSKLMTATN